MNYDRRIGKLRKLIRAAGCDALLISNYTNVTYLTGFTGDDSYLLVSKDSVVLLSDTRFTTQLKEECPELDVVIRRSGVSMLDSVAKIVKKFKVSSLGCEADAMTVALYEKLAEKLKSQTLVSTNSLVEQLRIIKDAEEISEIRSSIRLAERCFDVLRATLQPEQSEAVIAANLEHQIRMFGGKGCSFAPIVAVGPRAALPHAHPGESRVCESDFILIDWGATRGLYLSDLTRVLVTGRISPKLKTIYGVVLKAQLRAIAAIKPGITMGTVDAAAREVIAKAGYDKYFGHGLGHGFGLEIHESPRMAPNVEQTLQAGMVITVEPGIYLPGWGGVRIEDDILVTRSGHEVLSNVPKELDDCRVSL